MAAEARYNTAKSEWLDTAANVRDSMEDSKRTHKNEKDSGITSNSWEQWVPQNDPRFASEWQQFQQKQSTFQMALKNFDSAKYEAWNQAYQTTYKEKYYGNGEEHGSNYLIITPEV